ncbi:MAG: aspartate aminotransferase family protein [Ectothiorhodospiraceae bacterium]|nr:aspartate aminotransferase family protein [Ectothiorhodospiraceae bacterium]
MSASTLKARRDAVLGAGTPLFYDEPVTIVRGRGVELWDDAGRRYVDMYNNVPCVGHAHPRVVAAMQAQAGTLNVHSRYLHEGIVDYAERLVAKHHDGIEAVVFTCTGTEANEVALMMARAATGGRGIICTDAAYHGNSAEVGKLTRVDAGRNQSGAEVRSIPFPQRYRPLPGASSDAALTGLYLDRVQAAIDAFAADGVPFAGMLVCSILANEGLPDIPVDFMPRAAEMVRAAGGVFIADEVQSGFCRTGTWWGYHRTGFAPDIVSMGKPMGNGLPLAGAAASRAIVDAFRRDHRYFNTFASSPLQAAVGAAVLDVLDDEALADNAERVGALLRDRLRALQARYPRMGDVRGHGLFCGVEWVSDPDARTPDRDGAAWVVNRLKERGFLISNAGALGNVLKIRPPLVFEASHAEEFLGAFEAVLEEVHGAG